MSQNTPKKNAISDRPSATDASGADSVPASRDEEVRILCDLLNAQLKRVHSTLSSVDANGSVRGKLKAMRARLEGLVTFLGLDAPAVLGPFRDATNDDDTMVRAIKHAITHVQNWKEKRKAESSPENTLEKKKAKREAVFASSASSPSSPPPQVADDDDDDMDETTPELLRVQSRIDTLVRQRVATETAPLTKELNEARERNTILVREAQTQKSFIEQLKTEVAQHAACGAEKARLDSRVAELEREVANLNTRLHQAQEQKDKHEDKLIRQAEKQRQEFVATIVEKTTEAERNKAEAEKMKAQFDREADAMMNEFKRLVQHMTSVQDKLAKMDAAAHAEVGRLSHDLHQQRNETARLSKEAKEAREEADRLRASLKQALEIQETKDKEIAAAKEETRVSRAQHALLAHQLDEARKEHMNLRLTFDIFQQQATEERAEAAKKLEEKILQLKDADARRLKERAQLEKDAAHVRENMMERLHAAEEACKLLKQQLAHQVSVSARLPPDGPERDAAMARIVATMERLRLNKEKEEEEEEEEKKKKKEEADK